MTIKPVPYLKRYQEQSQRKRKRKRNRQCKPASHPILYLAQPSPSQSSQILR